MSLMSDLLSVERELWTGRSDSYLRHLDDDCLVAFVDMAGVSTKDEIADTVEGAPRWRDLQIEVEGFLRPNGTVAILTYRARATRGDGDPYRALISSAYVHRAGEWKLMFHQQTPLPS